MTAMRAFIAEGPDAWTGEYADRLDNETDFGLSLLIHYSFIAAARRIFAPEYSLSQVIRYVADVRLALGDDAFQLNPRVAEQLIRSALGDKTLPIISEPNDDQATKTRAMLLLLVALTTDAELDESGLDELIHEAADNARQFDRSSLSAQKIAGSPHLEGGGHTGAGAAAGRGAVDEPSRAPGRGRESP